MSSAGGSHHGNGRVSGSGTASSAIPAVSRKTVQSLKEIVNCPDHEIYAMLKECNMDPNEAINRLLSQDPFHEVKSKREKKKECKDPSDSKPRGINSSSRGMKGSIDHGHGVSNQFNSFESSTPSVKPSYKKDNGQSSNTSSLSASGMTAYNSWQPPSIGDPALTLNKASAVGGSDGVSLSSQPSSGSQPAWMGVPGQVSMADIVKQGKLPGKTVCMPKWSQHNVIEAHALELTPAASHYVHDSMVSALNDEHVAAKRTDDPLNDEWTLIEEPPAARASPVMETVADFESPFSDSSQFMTNRTNQHMETQLDEFEVAEDSVAENFNSNCVGHASVSSLNLHRDGSVAAPPHEDDSLENKNSYQPQRNAMESQEDTSISTSSAAENFQHLSLQDDEHADSEEDSHSVKIPNHLQVQSEHFSHLSFGSFGAGINADIPGQAASLTSQSVEGSSVVDTSSAGHSDARNYGDYKAEHLRASPDGNISNRIASSGSYESPSVSQSDVLKQEDSKVVQANQYDFPSSASAYDFGNTEHPSLAHPQASSQMPNHPPFSTVYTSSFPNTLLASNVQPLRESDLAYSPFPVTQSMPEKFSNTMSSISGSTLSMPEALRGVHFSSPLPSVPTLPASTVAAGPALPQHLAVHPYSQPTLPLGHFTNMMGYPFLPQSYAYLPSAFQQPFSGSSYHQSLAAVLPHYKNSVSVSSLPQPAAVASGYGAFGSSSNLPGNFSLNPSPTVPTGSTVSYNDIISSHYKDGNPLISVHQNENVAMWPQGLGSRTMSGIPASTYYNYQAQGQQGGGFRQAQQPPSQHMGPLGYFYHALEQQQQQQQQQQVHRDGHQGGSQAQPSKQSQQIWQSGY